jgi:hypothetical protein
MLRGTPWAVETRLTLLAAFKDKHHNAASNDGDEASDFSSDTQRSLLEFPSSDIHANDFRTPIWSCS